MTSETPKKGISRRNFLKLGAFSAATFIAELAVPENVRAQIEKLIAQQESVEESFDKLLARMKEFVYSKQKEEFWLHIKKGGKEISINIRLTAKEDELTSVDLAHLYEDPDITEVSMVHTHPAIIFFKEPKIPKETAEKILREKRSNFPLIPSGPDIISEVIDRLLVKEGHSKHHIRHYLVEPSGTWSYETNLSHPKFKDLSLPKIEKDTPAEPFMGGGDTMLTALPWILNPELEEQQNKFHTTGGVSDENLAEFKKWAEEKWGIKFNYRRFDEASAE